MFALCVSANDGDADTFNFQLYVATTLRSRHKLHLVGEKEKDKFGLKYFPKKTAAKCPDSLSPRSPLPRQRILLLYKNDTWTNLFHFILGTELQTL